MLIINLTGIQHSWSYINPTEAFRRTLKLASLVGCPTSRKNRTEIIQCLIGISADDIVNKEVGVASPRLNYSPFVITNDYNKFITKPPSEILLENIENFGRIHDTGSVMMGMNQDEGSKALMYYLPRMFPNRELEINVITKQMFDDAIAKIFYENKSNEVIVLQRYKTNNQVSIEGEKQLVLIMYSLGVYNVLYHTYIGC